MNERNRSKTYSDPPGQIAVLCDEALWRDVCAARRSTARGWLFSGLTSLAVLIVLLAGPQIF